MGGKNYRTLEMKKKMLQLFLYYDDYENNNSLGSHAGVQKCGAIIEEYLNLLQYLFPNTAKHKHHFLIHYTRIMHRNGPIWNCRSICFLLLISNRLDKFM